LNCAWRSKPPASHAAFEPQSLRRILLQITSVQLTTASFGNITQGIGTGTILNNSSMTPPFGMHFNSLATTLAGIS